MSTEETGRDVGDDAEGHQLVRERLLRLAAGRRIANLCMFAWLAGGAFRVTEPPFGVLFSLGIMVASVTAVVRLASNFSTPVRYEFLFIATSFIPLFNLIPIAVLSLRAGKELRAAGFRVGMLDAQERTAI